MNHYYPSYEEHDADLVFVLSAAEPYTVCSIYKSGRSLALTSVYFLAFPFMVSRTTFYLY